MGTNNKELLNDPLYMGLQQTRVSGQAYYDFVDEFTRAVTERWPNVMLHFEDFSNENARTLLDKYRWKYLGFNDDIQGTGAMVVAGVLGALRAVGKSPRDLSQQKIVCLGAGSAGLGVVDCLNYAMQREGTSPQAAGRQFYLIDAKGLIGQGREQYSSNQADYARDDLPNGMKLEEVVRAVKPDVLLGLSGVGKTFTEATIRAMAEHVPRPIVFPLSNPTDLAECSAEDAFRWTDGRAIFASGSPFDPVTLNGRTHIANQGNNMYIFPAVGLAASVCNAASITDAMLYTASLELADCLTSEELKAGKIFPPLRNIRQVCRRISIAGKCSSCTLCSRFFADVVR